ncbi:NmrA/HSCARG family protein [Mycobacterium sp. BMJ-28]
MSGDTHHVAPVAVIGATGGQGSAVLTALTERRRSVRAVTRDPRSPRAQAIVAENVTVVGADLADEEALTAAFEDVSGVFAVTTPFEDGPHAEVEQGLHIIAAAQRARVPYLVYSSVAGADQDSGVPHFQSKAVIEAALTDTGLAHTVVGPTYFFDNLLGGLDALRAGILDMPLPPDIPLQQLARRDLGRFVATLFDQPAAFTGLRIDLASDQLTPTQMAHALQRKFGRPIELVTADPATIANDDMRAMFTFLAERGYAANPTSLHREFRHVGWQRFDDWLDEAVAVENAHAVR